jgi:diguanylate cyclase (GGDEF)-like protein
VKAGPAPDTTDPGVWLRMVQSLRLGTQLYILLLAAALPLCLVAAYQALSSWTISRDIAHELPIYEAAARRDAQFKVFMEGLLDAVDIGSLSTKSVEAVRRARTLTDELGALSDEPMAELVADLDLVVRTIEVSRAPEALRPLSRQINRASNAIAASAELHHARLDGIVVGSVQASRRDAVSATLITVLSMSFAIGFGRRLIQHILRVERTAHEASALNQAIMDAAPIGLMTFGADAQIATANRACHSMHGYEADELPGQHADLFLAAPDGEQAPGWLHAGGFAGTGDHGGASSIAPASPMAETDRTHRRKDGSHFAANVIELPLRDAKGQLLGGLCLVTDVTERKRAAARVEHLAHHDFLTGLPNRLVLQQRAEQAVDRAQRHGGGFALALIDLDRFKQINDSLGHAVGDGVLRLVADRLKGAVRSTDTVVRMGGDEFALLLPDTTLREQANEVGQKVLNELAKVAVVDGHTLHLSASVGMAFFPEHGEDLKALVRSADAAMYDAKSRGRDALSLYDSAMTPQSEDLSELRADLRRAVSRDEFVLHYQPIVDAISGEIRAFEALVRWHQPERGMVMPATFIALAEDTGLIVPIGEWVVRQACADLARLRGCGLPDLRMAVNVSPRQFMSDGLEACVHEALRAAGLPGSALELEITESVLMNSVNRTQKILKSLREFGVRIAIDDFGTGYSSLSYLANFPVHTLKIDRSFVGQIEGNGHSASLTGAIISMGHSLGLEVVAEGVENAEQQALLVRLGCDLLQGYKFARPVPFEQLPMGALRAGSHVPCQAAGLSPQRQEGEATAAR